MGRHLGLWLVVVVVVAMTTVTSPAFGSTIVPPSKASTSSRGVTSRQINVVFPISNLSNLASQFGFAGDVEYSEQAKAIRLFVGNVNDHGGINGRKINPIIVNFDPTNDAEMRALCKDWTQGSPAAFAVLDGIGTWLGENQLCVAEDGHTPVLSQWSTINAWTDAASPYLWWTGPSQTSILQAVVNWGLSSGLLGPGHKVGIIVGDRASDQAALNQALLPDLKRAGVTNPVIETIPADPDETSETSTAAPLVVERLRSAHVESVIPLMPFNAMFPVLQAETEQQWFPRLLLSDYESSIESALGLIPVPYARALNGQEGVTTYTLGGIDDDRPYSEGGYDPGVRACWVIWHQAYPQIPKGNENDFIEEQGPVQGWCQEIRLFTAAAKAAGRNLNRRTFVEAMSRIRNFPGGYSPILSYGPTRFAGPTQYQVVRLHINSPPSSQCKTPLGHLPPQVVCWVSEQAFQPLPSS